ncbi:MAG: hypothetical protein PHZ00_04155 [Candidatus Peribacteraceae bacterium]|nr:hypothetical protein [Candidatus Peribacteraceae bacterium]
MATDTLIDQLRLVPPPENPEAAKQCAEALSKMMHINFARMDDLIAWVNKSIGRLNIAIQTDDELSKEAGDGEDRNAALQLLHEGRDCLRYIIYYSLQNLDKKA